MDDPIGVAVLGATGSIGTSALQVLRLQGTRFRVVSLTGWKQIDALRKLVDEFSPALVAAAPQSAEDAGLEFSPESQADYYVGGDEGLVAAATHPDVHTVIAGVSGAAGLQSTLAAVRAGKRVLLANKEPLVMCGQLLRAAAAQSGACLLPIDSEHNAIFQCLPLEAQRDVAAGRGICAGPEGPGVSRIALTASGGPFLRTPASGIAKATPNEALAHPTWNMGPKISIDSATLMNKGLELIEACTLFGLDESQVEVIIHPQSVVHSVVHFSDGSLIGQMGSPDMRVPITHGLAYPERAPSGVAGIDLTEVGQLQFELPDLERFPSLKLARQAAKEGRSAPIVLNAANEVAVQAFLDGRIEFGFIPEIVDRSLERHEPGEVTELAQVIGIDRQTRIAADDIIRRILH